MSISGWNDFLHALEPSGDLISDSWMAHDERFQADFQKQLANSISMGYFLYFQADPDHPDWTPLFNQVHTAQPNPDDTYYWSPVKGSGTYRVSGHRGNVHMLMFSVSCGLIGMSEPPGPALGTFDLADMEIEEDGRFEAVFSAERPAGWDGNWVPLDARAEYLIVRQRHYDWLDEYGTQVAIEALHPVEPKPRMSPSETHDKLSELALFTQRLPRVFLQYHNALRERTPVNELEITDFGEWGGLQSKQAYWQGIYEVVDDDAIVIDVRVPDGATYWNIQINDLLFNAVDYIYHQSTLNGHTARLTQDGHFWAVLSVRDPGIANWIDTAGHETGVVVGRWMGAQTSPLPRLRRVRFEELCSVLPSDAPTVTPEERAAALRERVRGHQLRRRW